MTPVIDICPLEELPPGEHRLVEWEDLEIGVFNCNGELRRDRGSLLARRRQPARGRGRPGRRCTVECPRHGSVFDCAPESPLNLPAYVPIDTFPVSVEDGVIRLEVD